MEIIKENILTIVRLLLGWFMFFAGLEKIIDPTWSAAGFLTVAKTFPNFYAWFAEPFNIWWINPLNEWGIFFVGVALLLGIFIRPAALAGAFLMIVYYFPQVDFPIIPHGFIVEEHIIYAACFIMIAVSKNKFTLSEHLQKTALVKIPYLGKYI